MILSNDDQSNSTIEFTAPGARLTYLIVTLFLTCLSFIVLFIVNTAIDQDQETFSLTMLFSGGDMTFMAIIMLGFFLLILTIWPIINWFMWERHPRHYLIDHTKIICRWLQTNKEKSVSWNDVAGYSFYEDSGKIIQWFIKSQPNMAVSLFHKKKTGFHVTPEIMVMSVPLEFADRVKKMVQQHTIQYVSPQY